MTHKIYQQDFLDNPNLRFKLKVNQKHCTNIENQQKLTCSKSAIETLEKGVKYVRS